MEWSSSAAEGGARTHQLDCFVQALAADGIKAMCLVAHLNARTVRLTDIAPDLESAIGLKRQRMGPSLARADMRRGSRDYRGVPLVFWESFIGREKDSISPGRTREGASSRS